MSLNQFDLKYDLPRCDGCGRYISKEHQNKQFKSDGKDCFRIIYCKKCKNKEKKNYI